MFYGSPHFEFVPVLLSLVLVSNAFVRMTNDLTHEANVFRTAATTVDPSRCFSAW